MIRIFSNLDNNVSNPNPSGGYPLRNKTVQSVNASSNVLTLIQTSPQDKDKVRGILHIPTAPSSCENIDTENIETPPKEDDSDNESRVYMKPGSYNVPKKSNSPEYNDGQPIEFFETAQNVSAHYKKLAKKKQDFNLPVNNDKLWHDAQSAVPNLMNKINPMSSSQDSQQATKIDDVDAESLKYFIDLDTGHQGSDIQEWLNNNNFFENNDMNDGSLSSPNHIDLFTQTKPITVLQRSKSNRYKENLLDFQNDVITSLKNNKCLGSLEIASRTYRKRNDTNDNQKVSNNNNKAFNAFKKVTNIWELEKGGLTPNTIILLEKTIRNLEQEKLARQTQLDNKTKVIIHFSISTLSL